MSCTSLFTLCYVKTTWFQNYSNVIGTCKNVMLNLFDTALWTLDKTKPLHTLDARLCNCYAFMLCENDLVSTSQ